MHESTDVWAIRFDNGDSLGVTGSHPIYSLDANSWVLASTLSTDNQVLTKSGAATVTSVKKLSGSRKVYNLEVRDLHNFLVGRDGVVVHNSCFDEVKEILEDFVTHKRVGPRGSAIRKGNKIELLDGRSVPISGREFPDFTDFTARTNSGSPLAKKFDGLKGNLNRDFDSDIANTWLQNSGHLDDFEDVYFPNGNISSWVSLKKNGKWTKYTWHHHENGKTLMLVEQAVHNSLSHTGGATLIANKVAERISNYSKLFPDPKF